MKLYTPNATACSLLGFLCDSPLSGWDLYVRAQSLIGEFWSLTRSQVYRELIAMEEHGLIERGERGKRDRQPYSITPSGRKAFLAWLHEKPEPELIRFPLLLKLTFNSHLEPKKAQEFLQEQRIVHEKRLAQYQRHKASILQEAHEKQPMLPTVDFGIRYEQAFLAWIKEQLVI